jgi:hypothetical protein
MPKDKKSRSELKTPVVTERGMITASGEELTREELTDKLTGLFAGMPCDLSEPELTPDEQAEFDREQAEEWAEDLAWLREFPQPRTALEQATIERLERKVEAWLAGNATASRA